MWKVLVVVVLIVVLLVILGERLECSAWHAGPGIADNDAGTLHGMRWTPRHELGLAPWRDAV